MRLSPVDGIVRAVARETELNLAAWQSADAGFPCGLRTFTAQQQRDNERQLELLLDRARDILTRDGATAKRDRMLLARRARLATNVLLLRVESPAVQRFLKDCEDVAETFGREARAFDPSLSAEDILQALRNQWVFNSLQHFLGHPVSVTPSSFAYSMLYPYTDNCLDAIATSQSELRSFLLWLTSRLHGVFIGGSAGLSGNVGRLLEKIDSEFPRASFPSVHASLLAIHSAQEKSLALRNPRPGDSEGHLLSITIEKGGTSVLADGLLVNGSLTPAMVEVFFAYGVILQFIDDLQDLREDAAAGCSTPFTRAASQGALDRATNRLFAYLSWCVALMRRSCRPNAAYLTDLIEQSCSMLILEAVASNQEFYPAGYAHALEKFMPMELECFAVIHRRVDEMIHNNTTFATGEPHYAA